MYGTIRCEYPSAPVGVCSSSWQISGSDSYEVCEYIDIPDLPHGGGTTNPGGGTNTPFPTSVPCVVTAMIITNATYTNTLTAAKNNWLTLDYESGYTFTNSSDINTYNFVFGTAGDAYINLSLSTSISGMVHTHPSGIKDTNGNPVLMSMVPTPEDFAAIGTLFNAGLLTNPSQFTSVVITGQGTAYLITISDPNLFKTWTASHFQRPGGDDSPTKFENDYNQTGLGLLAGGYSMKDAEETSLLYNLQNSGVNIVRGNINNLYGANNWVPIKYNSTTYRPETVPCP